MTSNAAARSGNPDAADRYPFIVATDSSFLLRSALLHDWDNVAELSNFLAACCTLNNKSSTVNKNQALQQIRACDQYGNSVLQAACYYRPPMTAIRALLRAANTLSCGAELVNHASLDQSTALQVACATGASLEVIEALLQAGWKNRTAVSTRLLVRHHDRQGSTPLSELVVQYTLERKGPTNHGTAKALEDIHDVATECTASPFFHTFWSKVEILIMEAWKADQSSSSSSSSSNQEQLSLLHGAASLASTCPAILTDMIVRCYGHHAKESVVVASTGGCGLRRGWLPLHLALSSTNDSSCPTILLQQQQHFVASLLQVYPEAARIPIPFCSEFQRKPLHHGILEGLRWHVESKIATRTAGPLQMLCGLDPSSLSERDEATGYFPWQLAALINCDNEALKQLDTVYNLLRECPKTLVHRSSGGFKKK
jgi:hypothetical protein